MQHTFNYSSIDYYGLILKEKRFAVDNILKEKMTLIRKWSLDGAIKMPNAIV